MRDTFDFLKLLEGDVVSLQKVKSDKAAGEYANALSGIYGAESDFFKQGKFLPFAASYIESGFKASFAPEIIIDVNFRDYKPNPAAKALLAALRAQRYKIEPPPWKKGSEPKENPNQQPHGPFARKYIDLNTAKELFAGRDDSPLGAYQKSRSGMRTAPLNVWDDNGIGFNVTVGGMDNRRGEKPRQEHHIIDDEKDMKEVADTYAAIQRAKIRGV